MSSCSVCPHCEHSLLTRSATAVQHSVTAPIPQKVHHLEELIGQLTEKRVALLQKLNEDQASTAVLPSEILSTIFEYACPPIDFTTRPFLSGELDSHPQSDIKEQWNRYTPLVLGGVSSHWRQIAWSTPKLWTTLAMEIWPALVQIRGAISLLQLYLQNVGALPFVVELDFRKQQKACAYSRTLDESPGLQTFEVALEPIRELIFSNYSHKIRSLRLSAPPPKWVSSLSKDFSRLEDVSLGWPLPSPVQPREDISLAAVTNLSRLNIRNMVTDLKVHLHWPTITDLNLCGVRYKTCIELLLRSPNLVSFKSLNPLHSNSTDTEPWFREPIALAHLETFGWTCQNGNNRWDAELLRLLHLPSLKRLSLSQVDSNSDMVMGMSFFPRLPSTLESLELDALYHQSPDAVLLEHIFSAVPQLSQLTLSNSCSGLLTMIFQSLTPPSDITGIPLPALRSLRCRNVRNHCRAFTESENCRFNANPFTRMLEARKERRKGSGLRFEVMDDCETTWEAEARERIVEMVRDGLELQILQDSESVQWLNGS